MNASQIVLTAMVAFYWIAVILGEFEPRQWTNINADTWIHACLAAATLAVVRDWLYFGQRKMKAGEVEEKP